jgi:NADP-dependent 3-hydroxy acid dehydrogenase YdfG
MLDRTNLQAKRRRTRPSLAGMTSPTVLITGCSSGIGFATAQAFARGGATVFASARRPETLTSLTGEGVQTLALDVLEDDSMRAAVSEVEARCGAIDVLVNNAGYALQAPVEEANLDDVRRQFETNVFGLVRLTQLVLPAMRQQRSGRVINLSSMGGRFTFPGGGFYHATKHAVESLSDALRLELAPFGICVVVIEPDLCARSSVPLPSARSKARRREDQVLTTTSCIESRPPTPPRMRVADTCSPPRPSGWPPSSSRRRERGVRAPATSSGRLPMPW